MATKDEKRKDPSTPSAAYEHMAPKWAMIDTLLGGTASMRDAAETYLPPHAAEHPDDYNARLACAVLFNVTELTLESLVGRVFREEMKLNDDVPAQLVELSTDIDLQGNTISAFSALWFREALAKGFAHIYIDMPSISDEERATRTKADDLKSNHRPFWSLIKPENMIFTHYDMVGGVETLMHARLVEVETAMDGFTETCRTFIRVLTPGNWERWYNESEDQRGRKPKWVVYDNGTYDLDVIPIVTFYTNKTGPMLAKPPLEDLCYLNITHWQSSSDQRNILTVARFPMLAASGTQLEAGKKAQPIGPRQLLTMRDPNGRFYYVEHTGQAIKAGKEDLEKLEDQMAAYGAEFLRRQIAGRTAFERAADGNEASSPLKRMATEFALSVAQALEITGKWIGVDKDTGTVTINKDYTEEDDALPQATTALTEARKRGDISRETWIEEMKRRAFLDPTLNAKEEIARLAKEFEEGPHPPTYFTGQVQVQGQPVSPGEQAQATGTDPLAGTDGQKVKKAKVVTKKVTVKVGNPKGSS